MTYTINEGAATTWSFSTVTARTIVTDAMREINAIGQGETVSANDANLGLSKLNRLIESFWVDNKYVAYRNIVSYAFDVSRTSYSIGPTGNFVGDRPIRIEKANLIRVSTDPDQHVPINVYDAADYFRLAYPLETAEEPTAIYYQAAETNGIIFPYPYPENTASALANKLELLIWSQLGKFSTLDTAVSLAPGYEDALILTLAERLCTAFSTEVPATLKRDAGKAREILISVNMASMKPDGKDYGIPDSEEW